MRQKQSQRTDAREAVKRAAQDMGAETAAIQQQAQDLRQTLADEANDDRPRLWVLPEDTPGHDKSGAIKDGVQEACPGYLVQVAVDAADGGVSEENVNAALLGATPGDLDSDDESSDDTTRERDDTATAAIARQDDELPAHDPAKHYVKLGLTIDGADIALGISARRITIDGPQRTVVRGEHGDRIVIENDSAASARLLDQDPPDSDEGGRDA